MVASYYVLICDSCSMVSREMYGRIAATSALQKHRQKLHCGDARIEVSWGRGYDQYRKTQMEEK